MASTTRNRQKKAPAMSETLRQEIRNIMARGVSLYRVGKDSGVSYPALHRFVVHGQAASMKALDKLCAYLGLQLSRSGETGGES
jgi:hypothetical protein